MELDHALERAGGFGRFQALMFVLMGFVNMRGAGFLLGIVFIGDEPRHHCKLSPNSTLNDSIPWVKTGSGYDWDKCSRYVTVLNGSEFNNLTNRKTESCRDGWIFDTDYKSTVVTEWDLVCTDNYLVELSTMVFMFGLAFGSLFISPLSDKFGRKKVLVVCLMLQAVLGIGLAFTTDIYQFIVLRFIIGALNRAIDIIAFVLMTEFFPAKHRTWPCIYNQMFWAVGLMAIGGLAYLVRDWRHLQLVISVPILLMISYICIVPESVRWLLTTKQTGEANRIMQRIAKMNGKALPEDCLTLSQEASELMDIQHPDHGHDDALVEQRPDYIIKRACCCPEVRDRPCIADNDCALTMINICCHPRMRTYTVVVCFLWMVNALDYYGIQLSTSSLAGDRYVNFFLSAAVEIPAYVIGAFGLDRFGRRKMLCAFHMLSGVANCLTAFIPEKSGDTDLTPLITTLAMIGKFGITGSFSTMFLYSAEVFPTVVRNTAIGFASFWDTLGGMAAPIILYSAKAKSIPELPRTIFGSASITAGLLILLMPETLNRPLPETIADIEGWEHAHITCTHCKNSRKHNENNKSI